VLGDGASDSDSVAELSGSPVDDTMAVPNMCESSRRWR
jgi:hypothetical protein